MHKPDVDPPKEHVEDAQDPSNSNELASPGVGGGGTAGGNEAEVSPRGGGGGGG